MFDADPFAGKRIWPTRDVAGREDARNAGLEILIDRDAAIDSEAGSFRQRSGWPHPDADDNKIGKQPLSTFQCNALCCSRSSGCAKRKGNTMVLMELTDKLSCLWPEDSLHRNRFAPDHMHIDIPGAERCCHLEPDEAGADYHGSSR